MKNLMVVLLFATLQLSVNASASTGNKSQSDKVTNAQRIRISKLAGRAHAAQALSKQATQTSAAGWNDRVSSGQAQRIRNNNNSAECGQKASSPNSGKCSR